MTGNPRKITQSPPTWKIGADIASATALVIGTDGNYFDVTGTTTITSFTSRHVGMMIRLHFDGAVLLTHHSTNLVLPGAANITTQAGDEFTFVEYGVGTWRCTGFALASGGVIGDTITSSADITLQLGDNAGVYKLIINDSDSAEVASINSDGEIVGTHLHITDTATAIGDHLVELTIGAGGFGDIHAIETHFATGTLADGQDQVGHDIEFDDTGSTGGNAHGISVSRTATGSATIGALKVNAEVDVIDQDSGTFGDVENFLIIAVDKKAEANSATASDLPYFLAQNDTITIGSLAKYGSIDFVIATPDTGPGIAPTFEYSTGASSFAAFTPIDNTSGFKHSGTISWVVANLAGWVVDSNTEFRIRIKRTRGSMPTPPVGSQVQVASTSVYSWDKDGDVSIRELTLSGAANFQDNTLSRTNLLDTAIVTQTLTGTGNQTIDLEAGNSVKHVAFGAITWTFSNPPAQPALGRIDLSLVGGGIGAQTFTNVIWENGSAPVLLDTQQDYTTDFGVDDKLNIPAHDFINGERVHSTTTGVHPANLNANIVYYVINATTNDFEVSLTLDGSAIDIADDGTGTHTIHSGENRLIFITVDGGITWLGRAPVSTGIVMADGAIIFPTDGTTAVPGMQWATNVGITGTINGFILSEGGVGKIEWNGNVFGGRNGTSGTLFNITSMATVPTLVPDRSTTTTGIGGTAGDLSLIVEGVEAVRLIQASSQILVKNSVHVGLTANDGGGGSGSALVLLSSFNEVSTVGTSGDSVILPTAVAGYEIYIINNGSNAMNVFPATSDNLGGGVDTAVSLAAGSNIRYFAYDDTNWEVM